MNNIFGLNGELLMISSPICLLTLFSIDCYRILILYVQILWLGGPILNYLLWNIIYREWSTPNSDGCHCFQTLDIEKVITMSG